MGGRGGGSEKCSVTHSPACELASIGWTSVLKYWVFSGGRAAKKIKGDVQAGSISTFIPAVDYYSQIALNQCLALKTS